ILGTRNLFSPIGRTRVALVKTSAGPHATSQRGTAAETFHIKAQGAISARSKPFRRSNCSNSRQAWVAYAARRLKVLTSLTATGIATRLWRTSFPKNKSRRVAGYRLFAAAAPSSGFLALGRGVGIAADGRDPAVVRRAVLEEVRVLAERVALGVYRV